MGDPKYFETDTLSPVEKHKVIRALSRIKTEAIRTGELTFVFFAFKGSTMIYSESHKMARTEK
jgi:hypothetical protein